LNLHKGDAKTAWYVTRAIVENFEKLPKEIRNLLGVLKKPLRELLMRLSDSQDIKREREALEVYEKVSSITDAKFLSKVLDTLLDSKHKTVREKAERLLSQGLL